MLHILGMILKIAAILLGSILGMILLLLLLVLFVPIRYRVEGSYEEKPLVKARISWLLSILLVRVQYEGQGAAVKVKIFGIPLKKKEKSVVKPEKKSQNEPEPQEEPQASELEESGQQEKAEIAEKTGQEKEMQSQQEVQKEPCDQPQPKKPSIMDKIRAFLEKIKCTIKNICDKIKEIGRKKNELQAFIRDEKNREAFRLLKRELIRLWKHIRPRKLSISCHFGFEDPSVTGQVLAVGAVLYPVYRNKINLYPNFEQNVLSGEGYLSGRIRIFPLLLIIIRLWKNKQIRNIVGKFMK